MADIGVKLEFHLVKLLLLARRLLLLSLDIAAVFVAFQSYEEKSHEGDSEDYINDFCPCGSPYRRGDDDFERTFGISFHAVAVDRFYQKRVIAGAKVGVSHVVHAGRALQPLVAESFELVVIGGVLGQDVVVSGKIYGETVLPVSEGDFRCVVECLVEYHLVVILFSRSYRLSALKDEVGEYHVGS